MTDIHYYDGDSMDTIGYSDDDYGTLCVQCAEEESCVGDDNELVADAEPDGFTCQKCLTVFVPAGYDESEQENTK